MLKQKQKATYDVEIPEHNDTISRRVISVLDGKRRVRETRTHVITDGDDVHYMEEGDTILWPESGDADHATEKIVKIGSDVSTCNGLHAKMASGRVVQFGIIKRGVDKGTMVVHGVRTHEFSEVEGTDY